MIVIDLDLLRWSLLVTLGLALASWAAHQTWRSFLRRARGPASAALGRDGARATALDALFDPLEAAHPGQSGLLSLLANADAFAARALSAEAAGRSLDIMSYIWRTDLSGWLLLDRLVAAADRGVRVRLLLDDVNVQGYDRAFLALSAHPMIEVRLFNPTRHRGLALRRVIEMALGLARFNRRMHGKLWIADGRLALLGGRNIGDTYFGATEGKPVSVDADVMLVGPKVAEVADLFDSYWNLGLSLPIRALWPGLRLDMDPFRRRLARKTHGAAARHFDEVALAGRGAAEVLTARLHWTGKVTLLADPPEKAYADHAPALGMAEEIAALIAGARREVLLITPYFVPGHAGMAGLAGLGLRGVRVCLLTNALACCDKLLVFGAYRHYRAALLASGGRMFEFLRPGRSDVLHSKVFVIDGRQAVIGSLNFDLRSARTNTELGLLFEAPALVDELTARFAGLSGPDQAFEVRDEAGHLSWCRPGQGPTTTEPGASRTRRALVWILGHLPIERYL